MSRVRDLADNNVVFVDGITTADITEHTNLFFTDARADARLTLKMVDEDNMSSNSAAHMPTQQSVKAYVDTEVASLVDSSPSTLDTLNELAAALGDDPNFATTTANNIATKVSKTGDTMSGALTVGNTGGGANRGVGIDPNGEITQNATDGSWLHLNRHIDGLVAVGHESNANLYVANNVGIGTTSPQSELHIEKAISGDQSQLRISNGAGATMRMGITGSGTNEHAHIKTNSAENLEFHIGQAANSTSPNVVFKSGGNVGIGNVDPVHPIHIYEDGGYYASIGRGNSTPGGSDPWLGLFNNTNIANATFGWGIYDSNADGSFQIWNKNNNTTGFNALTIKRGGNVGIGTNGPASLLDVRGVVNVGAGDNISPSSSSAGQLRINGSGYDGFIALDGTGMNIGHNSSVRAFSLHTNETPRLTISAAGNVGIGESNPGSRLDVINGTANTQIASFSGADHGGGLKIKTASTTRNDDTVIFNASDAFGEIAFASDNTEVMRISDSYKVGIGTDNPQTPLHIETNTSGITTELRLKNLQDNRETRLSFWDENNINQLQLQYDNGSNRAYLNTNGNGLTVYSNQSSGEIARFGLPGGGNNYISSYFVGNVGIGTASPTEKLHVAGVIRSEGYDTDSITSYHITGSYTAGTEYVFTTRSQINGLGYGAGFYKFAVWSDTFHAGTSHYQCYTPYDEFYFHNYGSNTSTVQTINYGVSMGHAPNTGTRAIDIRLRHKYGADATYPANQTFTFIPVSGFTNLNGNAGYHLRIYLFKVA